MEGLLETLYPINEIEESLTMFSDQSSSAPCHMNWFISQLQKGKVCEVISLVLNSIVKDREAFCERIGHILEDAEPVLKTGVNLFSFFAHRILPCISEMCRQKHNVHIKHVAKVENMLKKVKTPESTSAKIAPVETFEDVTNKKCTSNLISKMPSLKTFLFWIVLAIAIYIVIKVMRKPSIKMISLPPGSRITMSAAPDSIDFLKTL